MSSGPGAHQDYYNARRNSMINLNNHHHPQPTYRLPLPGILTDPSSQIQLRRPDLIGKRSLAEFQHHQLQQQAAFYLRTVKKRPYINNNMTDFSISPEVSSLFTISNKTSSSISPTSVVPRYGVPVMQSFNNLGVMGTYQNTLMGSGYSSPVKKLPENIQESDGKKMMKQLEELEKQLLLDDDDGENVKDVSSLTDIEWSEIISPASIITKPENILSPTSSSSSLCASMSASPAAEANSSELLSEAARAIADGKIDKAVEILTRVSHAADARGTSEQKLCFYMTSALRFRMNVNNSNRTSELFGKDHNLSTQLLYDKSPCFKLAFMAANNAILEAGKKIHVLDFDIGNGVQYVYLLHEIAAAREARLGDYQPPFTLKLTTISDFGNGCVERLMLVGDGLKSFANKLGISFLYNVLNLKLSEVNTTSLRVELDDILVVNFAFKLYKLPDESVTVENIRDEVLRRVKGLSPTLVTVVEHELNGNTASFETRVTEARGYYGALFGSLDATIGRDHSDRAKIDEGLSRKILNSVVCEGRDRVERCEMFGKWKVRMSMAGFKPKEMSQLSSESFSMNVQSVTRGNTSFTVKEEGGGISLGWMGRTLTFASSWH